jgi:hypothetical protein
MNLLNTENLSEVRSTRLRLDRVSVKQECVSRFIGEKYRALVLLISVLATEAPDLQARHWADPTAAQPENLDCCSA